MQDSFVIAAMEEKERAAFLRRQKIFKLYAETRDLVNDLSQSLELVSFAASQTRFKMERAWDDLRPDITYNDCIWAECRQKRHELYLKINRLLYKSNNEQQMALRCAKKERKKFASGKKIAASKHAMDRKMHVRRRERRDAEIEELISERRKAYEEAKRKEIVIDYSIFNRLKRIYEDAVFLKKALNLKLVYLRQKRDSLHDEFVKLRTEHEKIRESLEQMRGW